jgi:hypothetical protein
MRKYPVRCRPVQNLSIACQYLSITMILAGMAFSFDEPGLPILPADEDEASRMLAEGSLDSSLWNDISQFYTATINVPRGELAILQELFYNLPDDLPVTAAALSAFEPWGKKERERFYETYPDMEPFAPILTFETPSAGLFPGQTAFYFSRRGVTDTSRQYVRFSAGREKVASVSGRVDFTNAYGRWQRRSVAFAPAKNVRIEAGNFGTTAHQKLFLGYFPGKDDDDSLPAANWLYGGARTWNGARMRAGTTRRGDKTGLSAEVMLHDRPSERIAFFESGVALTRRGTFFTGVSYLQTHDSIACPEQYYIHGAFSCDLGYGWKADAVTGIVAAEPRRVPLLLDVSNQVAGNHFRSTLSFLPKGFFAPRSRLFISALNQDEVSADLYYTHSYSTFFSIHPEINCRFGGSELWYLAASIGVRGAVPVTYGLRYAWLPDLKNGIFEQARHQGAFSIGVPLGTMIFIDCSNTSTIQSSGYWRNRTIVAPGITFSRALFVTPIFIISGSASSAWERIIGIKQVLSLQEKTFTEFSIEQQVPFSSWESVRAYGKMSFTY